MPESELRELPSDEYWSHEVIGCRVVLADGSDVGLVNQVVSGPSQDLLSVSTPRDELLVPLVKEFIIDIDVDARLITIDPPEGLLG